MEPGENPIISPLKSSLKENLLQIESDDKNNDQSEIRLKIPNKSSDRERSTSQNNEKYIIKINSKNSFDYLIKNDKNKDKDYENLNSNQISTSKYNCINVFPKILIEQFSKVANLYFLFLAILQMLPEISPSGGSPVILIPLIFVVFVNGLKDYYEDYKRKESDNRENRSSVIICTQEGDKVVKWEDIQVGSIIKVPL